ncbi:MAG: DUF4347 domain-containing protein, partial [Cyanobacteria bacterium P01_G01_bin.54]
MPPSYKLGGQALTESADILLYSCFTALGATGEALVQNIASLTGADVAASLDATGSANYDANWALETNTGTIEANHPFTTATLTDWDGKLATLTVTNLNNTGAGSLRERIQTDATAGDLITFSVSGTITLAGTTSGVDGEILWTTDNLTLDSGNTITLDGGANSRALNIAANNATLQNLVVQNASGSGAGGGIAHSGTGQLALNNVVVTKNGVSGFGSFGGGIWSNTGNIVVTNSTVSQNGSIGGGGGIHTNSGSVTLVNSTVSGNTSIGGGGIASGGLLTLTNSTVSGNSAGNGGGIYLGGDAILLNSTIAFNTTGLDGGGLFSMGSPNIQIQNTIVANNIDVNGGNAPDISANLSNGTVQYSLITNTDGISGQSLINGVNGNIIGQDPLLGSLQNNGGSTATHALLPGSPAINAGNNSLVSVSIDQNGNLRIVDFNVDIGAYELQTITTSLPDSCLQLGCTPLDPLPIPELLDPNAQPVLSPIPEDVAIAIDTLETTEAELSQDYGNLVWDDVLPIEEVGEAEAFGSDLPPSELAQIWDYAELIASEIDAEIPVAAIAAYIYENDLLDEVIAAEQYIAPEDLRGLTLPEIQITFTDVQDILQALQAEAGIQPALIYFTFAPRGTTQAQASETLFASTHPDFGDSLFTQSRDQDELKLILMTPEAYPEVIPIPGVTRRMVMQQARSLRRSLNVARGDRYLEPAQQLYDWLIRPLRSQIDAIGIDNLAMIPAAGLRSLPVAALHDGDR